MMQNDPPPVVDKIKDDKQLKMEQEVKMLRSQCEVYMQTLHQAQEQIQRSDLKAQYAEARAMQLQQQLNSKTLKAAQAIAPMHLTELSQRHKAEVEHYNLRIKALDENLQRAVVNEDKALEEAAAARKLSEKLSRRIEERDKLLDRSTREINRLLDQRNDFEQRYNESLKAAANTAQRIEDLEAVHEGVAEQVAAQERMIGQLIDTLKRNPDMKSLLKDSRASSKNSRNGNVGAIMASCAGQLQNALEATQKLVTMVGKLKRDHDRVKGELQREKDARDRIEKTLADLQNMVVRLESAESDLLHKLAAAEDRAASAEGKWEEASATKRQLAYTEAQYKKLSKMHDAAWEQVAKLEDQLAQTINSPESIHPLPSMLSDHHLEGAKDLLAIGQLTVRQADNNNNTSNANNNSNANLNGADEDVVQEHAPEAAAQQTTAPEPAAAAPEQEPAVPVKRKRGRPPKIANRKDENTQQEQTQPDPEKSENKAPFRLVRENRNAVKTMTHAGVKLHHMVKPSQHKISTVHKAEAKVGRPSIKKEDKQQQKEPVAAKYAVEATGRPSRGKAVSFAADSDSSSSEDREEEEPPKKRKRGRPKGSGKKKTITEYNSTRPPISDCTEKEFYDDLCAFLSAQRGIPLSRPQVQCLVVNGRPVDLFNLYKEVVLCGGFAKDNQLNWAGKIFPKMKNYTVNHRMTGIGSSLKKVYSNWLWEYEQANAKDRAADDCYICHTNDDAKAWISCDTCQKWQHFECDPRDNLGKFKDYSKGSKRKFVCAHCEDGTKKDKTS